MAAVLLCMSLPQHHLGQYNLCIMGAATDHKVKTFLFIVMEKSMCEIVLTDTIYG